MAKKKTEYNISFFRKIMIIGISAGLLICIAMFTFLGVFMNKRSVETMNEMGEMFMAGIGRQATMRYDAVVDQRITMVDGLRKTWIKDIDNDDIDVDGLKKAAEAREFTYLAFLKPDDTLELVYGYVEKKDGNNVTRVNATEVEPNDPNPFIASLKAGNSKVAVATGYANGAEIDKDVILIGVPTENRSDYKALITGLKNTTIVSMLSQKNSDNSSAQRFDTHIIRRNGSFVIHDNSDGAHDHITAADYFEMIKEEFDMEPAEGKALVTALKASMEETADSITTLKYFSSVVNTRSGRKHLYCEKVNHSEWYLVTVMEYTDLDAIVRGLSGTWTGFTIGACFVILLIMIGLFGIYNYMNKLNLKQVEEAKASAEEANKAKSDFLSNMSHDIRTPMNAIVGMTAIATANLDNRQQVADCLKKISLSSRHLLGLINDVLDMSKIESGKMTLNMEMISLNEVIEGIATIIQPQIKIKKQNFDIYVHDVTAEKVYCDSVRLNQVLLNLLSNAYKFTPENGKIELSLYQEKSPLGEKYVRTHVIVQDSGIGMSEEFKKKIFESFTREDSARVNKTEGTGLGMSITKYIVDSMHGTITVDSELGKGTKFHVTVDLEVAEEEEIDMILPEWKMLVVDDDQQLCDSTVASLADIGVKADSTLDGESAVRVAVDAHNKGCGYDIILMDWKLPGIDGIETAKRLHKALGKNIPILLISAYDWSEIEEEARAAGISGFISKPLFKSTLFYGLKQFTGAGSEPKKTKEEPKKKEASLEGKRILVAEDNDLNWEIAQLLLNSAGLEVEHAENGRICVDMLKASATGYYDAILMDIRMPVLNGLEATEEIRKLTDGHENIPIVAMTADAFS